MKEFTEIKKEAAQDSETKKSNTAFYIENGFCLSWSDERKTASDEGLERYSTETRWNQYRAGQITREKAVELATARATKAIEKETAAKLAKLEKIEKAPDLQYIYINVSYRKNATWGYNPTATANTNNGTTTGHASGCGYDKESAAIADAFNENYSILKTLYTIKENALEAGLSDFSKTACTGVDNRTTCGYGAGYGVFPYFEGGVGVGCFWDILKKAGFTTRCNYGKHENYYNVSMEV